MKCGMGHFHLFILSQQPPLLLPTSRLRGEEIFEFPAFHEMAPDASKVEEAPGGKGRVRPALSGVEGGGWD
jgi:hypothetical protein